MLEDCLVFADVKTFDLLLGYCPNKHLHIFGFHHQLDGVVDIDAMTLTTAEKCRECGCEVKRVDKIKWSKDVVFGGLGI